MTLNAEGIPGRVKIGPHVFEVRSDPATVAALRDDGRRAEARPNNLVISVDPELGKCHESLLHEILHAAWDQCPMRCSDNLSDHEEVIVTALAPILLEVLRDNPELVWWLTYRGDR